MATRALATQAEGGALAQQSDNPVVRFRGQLEQRANEFKMVLPAHITPEKFQRTILTAVQSDPELLKADRQSLVLACMKAAQDGLLPDKREAALVVFKENKKIDGQWVTKLAVQYMPMVYGLRKKILQSREVTDIKPNIVYRREAEEGHFIYEEGTEATLRHKPLLDLTEEEAADDQIVAAYSMATYADGTKSYEVMRRFEVDKVRECSQTGAKRDRKGQPRSPSGPWVDWYPEQAKKTVMRRHSKTLPMSGDVLAVDVEAQDEALYARSTDAVLSVEADAPTRSLAPPTRDDVAAGDPPHDPETGEIEPEESEEEIARRIDADIEAAREGRTDEQHGDQHDGSEPEADATTPTGHPFTDGLIARIVAATKLADLRSIDAEFVKHRAALDDEHVRAIENEVKAAKVRLAPPAA